jgi:hypothetical protein
MKISIDRFRHDSFAEAAWQSALGLAHGVNRRTLGPYIGASIWEREWDVLLVLDACRTDLMREVAPEYDALPERIGSVWSEASCSTSWIVRTFADEHLDQTRKTAYVTANPFSGYKNSANTPLSEDLLGHLDEVWRTEWRDVVTASKPSHRRN